MPFTKEQLQEILRLFQSVEDNKPHDRAAPTYRDIPALVRLAEMADGCTGTDRETLENKLAVYTYLTECYDAMCRTAVAVRYYSRLLQTYALLPDRTGEEQARLEECAYLAFKARNRYANDPCRDLLEVTRAMLPEGKAEQLLADARTRCRCMAKNDPVELTEGYLAVIDQVEQELDALLGKENRGMGFCHLYWQQKALLLQKRGIRWRSPGVLNPRIRFD